jgi:hypothetical protein
MTRRDLRTAEREYRFTDNREPRRFYSFEKRPFDATVPLAHLFTALALAAVLRYLF